VIQPDTGDSNPERASGVSVAGDSLLNVAQWKELLDASELAFLREFFELLAEWDDTLKGETTHE
jgi:hypothetical protein